MIRIAIITGATGGLGKEFTKQLIEEVDEIWAIGRNEKKLNLLKREFKESMKTIRGFSIDLSNPANLNQLKNELEKGTTNELKKELEKETTNELKKELEKETINELKKELEKETSNELKKELEKETTNELKKELEKETSNELKKELEKETSNEFKKELRNKSEIEIESKNENEFRTSGNKQYLVQYLVNNAGSGRMAASVDFTAEEIEQHINTHNTSMAILCNICIPYMGRGSHIINVASQSAFQPVAYINLYAASKAFCYSYSRALNMELKQKGIQVTVACPGWIKTELLQTEMNGHKVHFPHLAEPNKVVQKTIRDAKKGKDITVYDGYVRRMQFFSKFWPHKWIMRIWMKSIQKYVA